LSTTPPTNEPDDEQHSIVEEEYPVDRLRSRLNESLAGRPLTVYLVLFAGAATLLLLLGVVWISAQGGGDKEELICTEIATADARAAVFTGQVQRINILVDKSDPVNSLTGLQLRFNDGTCRQTPQGAALRNDLLGIIGAVTDRYLIELVGMPFVLTGVTAFIVVLVAAWTSGTLAFACFLGCIWVILFSRGLDLWQLASRSAAAERRRR